MITYRHLTSKDQEGFKNWVLDVIGLTSTRAVLQHGINAEFQRVPFKGTLKKWIEKAKNCHHPKLTVQPAANPTCYSILCWDCHCGFSFLTLSLADLWRLDTKTTKKQPGYQDYHSTYNPI